MESSVHKVPPLIYCLHWYGCADFPLFLPIPPFRPSAEVQRFLAEANKAAAVAAAARAAEDRKTNAQQQPQQQQPAAASSGVGSSRQAVCG
jgi:hypothetical protein